MKGSDARMRGRFMRSCCQVCKVVERNALKVSIKFDTTGVYFLAKESLAQATNDSGSASAVGCSRESFMDQNSVLRVECPLHWRHIDRAVARRGD